MPPEELAKLPGYSPDRAKDLAEARKIMEELGYSAAKPLKVKVATRNIPLYRDPSVIFIDQMKAIYIEGELENVDTPLWHAKVHPQGLLGRPQHDRRRRRRSRRQPRRELHLRVGAQLHGLLQQGGRQASSSPSRARPIRRSASRSCGRPNARSSRTSPVRSSCTTARRRAGIRTSRASPATSTRSTTAGAWRMRGSTSERGGRWTSE